MDDSKESDPPTLLTDDQPCVSFVSDPPLGVQTPSLRSVPDKAPPSPVKGLNSSPSSKLRRDKVVTPNRLRLFQTTFNTPRRNPGFSPPKEVPVVRKLNGLDDSLLSNKAENNAFHHAEEGHKVILGPMPCEEFLNKFLPPGPDGMPDCRGAFDGVPSDPSREEDIYEPLTKALNDGRWCPGITFCVTSDLSEDTGRGSLKVDVSAFNTEDVPLVTRDGDEEVKYESNMGLAQLFFELKKEGNPLYARAHHGPRNRVKTHFISYLNHKYTDEKNESELGRMQRKNLGQLFTYASECFKRQHRLFYFSLMIFCTEARFIRWDRAGCIVSSAFDYKARPETLCEFLWRFGHADAVQRGYDPTVVVASPTEEELFASLIKKHVAIQLNIDDDDTERLEKALAQHYEKGKVTKVLVRDHDKSSFYLVSVPLKTASSTAGQSTSVYWAVQLIGPGKGKVRCLKDSWRAVSESAAAEGTIYEEMDQKEVENVCNVIAFGDVPDIDSIEDLDDGKGDAIIATHPQEGHHRAEADILGSDQNSVCKPQCTKTNEYISARWVCKCLKGDLARRIPKRIHTRLVLKEAGYALKHSVGSRELFVGAKDALAALDSAYQKCGRIHCDVSIGNIILYRPVASEPRRGLLIDWESSRLVNGSVAPVDYNRSGTWPFMSIRALSGESYPQTHEDDMESLLYVVMYGCVRWVPHNHVPSLGRWIYNFFTLSHKNTRGVDIGGVFKEKEQFNAGAKFLETFRFENEYIRKWFRGAYKYLKTAHEDAKIDGVKSEWTMENLQGLFAPVCHLLSTVEETKCDRTEHRVDDYYVEVKKAPRGTFTSLPKNPEAQDSASPIVTRDIAPIISTKRRPSEGLRRSERIRNLKKCKTRT